MGEKIGAWFLLTIAAGLTTYTWFTEGNYLPFGVAMLVGISIHALTKTAATGTALEAGYAQGHQDGWTSRNHQARAEAVEAERDAARARLKRR